MTGFATKVRIIVVRPVWRRLIRLLQRRELRKGNERVIVNFEGSNLLLEINDTHDYLMLRSFRKSGCYERATTLLLRRQLQPGDLFIDGGANNGYFSVLACELVGSDGVVHSFEPNPYAFKRLESNIALNGITKGVRTHLMGLSNTEGVAELWLSEYEDGLATMRPSGSSSISVPVCRLESLDCDWRRTIVKLDIEGKESDVIESLIMHLPRGSLPRMIVEWNPETSDARLWDAFQGSYRIAQICESPSGYYLAPICDVASLLKLPLSNLWATPSTSG